MRSIQVYHFDELLPEGKRQAITLLRTEMENDFNRGIFYSIIDDDALFEPTHKEMAEMFGEDYYNKNGNDFLFKNTKDRIIESYDSSSYDIKHSLEITNEKMFFLWLGIPEILHNKFKYELVSTGTHTIFYPELTCTEFDYAFDILNDVLKNAESKFTTHMMDINRRIDEEIAYYYSDTNIIEMMIDDDREFFENGKFFET
jgi:hypothetical protein